MKKNITIAIDGYSSSGKSTMARDLASRLGYRYIDSGAMYRAATLYALRHNLFLADGTPDMGAIQAALPAINIDFLALPDGTQHTMLNGEDVESAIRGMEVSGKVSAIAAIPVVRHALVEKQKQFGATGGIVMDGRDIGTTVFPDAELKVFLDASAQTRAERRFKELQQKGDTAVTLAEVLANIEQRDHIDRTRAESPLRMADDAVRLDNSHMTIDEQNAWLDNLVAQRIGEK